MRLSKLLFILILFVASPVSAVSVSFEVVERAGVSQTNAPVSYGIPFSEDDNVLDVDSLGVTGVDAQFSVLSRYNGIPSDGAKPIRVVLVDFQTSITALQTKSFTITDAGSGTVAGNDLASDETGYIEITTGTATIRVSEATGNIFEDVWVGSTQIIDSPTSDGFIITYDGTDYSTGNNTPTVSIEENGPLRCVVKVEGEFEDSSNNELIPPVARGGVIPDSPLRYTLRYYAYKNKSYVKLHVTLKNENLGWWAGSTVGTHNISIDTAYIKTTITELDTNKTVAINGYSDTFTTETYELLQEETSDGTAKSYTWAYALDKDSTGVDSGTQYDSYFDVRDSTKGLMVADRWFWQNHPNGISVTGNVLSFELWPDLVTDHRILGAMWKTHELIYYFHETDTTFTDELAVLKKRLISKCSDTYYAQTQFYNTSIPGTITSDYTFPAGEELQGAVDVYQDNMQAKFDSSYITTASNLSLSELRDGREIPLTTTPTYADWYGWLSFGGFPRWSGAWGYSNMHYDWPYIAYSVFMRYGDYDVFDFSEEMVSHQADIIVLHDPDPLTGTTDYAYHGGHRYEQDALFSYNDDYSASEQSAPLKFSHFWTNQLGLQYLMTGDRRFYDAFEDSVAHATRRASYETGVETRNQTRAIAALVNGYWITGDSSYLTEAWDTYTNGLYTRVTDHAVGEQYINAENFDPAQQRLGMDTMMVHAIIKLRKALIGAGETANTTTLETFIMKWATHIRDSVYTLFSDTPGTYRNSNTEYFPYTTYSNIYIGTWEWVGSVPSDSIALTYSDLFALAYNVDNNEDWLNLARVVFKDAVYYNLVGWATTVETNTVDGFTTAHGDSWAKVGQKATRGRYYLMTEWQEGNGKGAVHFGSGPATIQYGSGSGSISWQ